LNDLDRDFNKWSKISKSITRSQLLLVYQLDRHV